LVNTSRCEVDPAGTQHQIKTVLTAHELSHVLPLHPVTILRWAREDRIPHRRLSARKIVFLLSEINEWLASGQSLYSEPAVRVA